MERGSFLRLLFGRDNKTFDEFRPMCRSCSDGRHVASRDLLTLLGNINFNFYDRALSLNEK
jgi:hypothetical protein